MTCYSKGASTLRRCMPVGKARWHCQWTGVDVLTGPCQLAKSCQVVRQLEPDYCRSASKEAAPFLKRVGGVDVPIGIRRLLRLQRQEANPRRYTFCDWMPFPMWTQWIFNEANWLCVWLALPTGIVWTHPNVRKISTSDYELRHVRLSVRMDRLEAHWTDFDKFLCLRFFPRKSIQKTQVLLKYDKNNEYLTWRRFHIYDNISLNSS
jgi:hypothetical protein